MLHGIFTKLDGVCTPRTGLAALACARVYRQLPSDVGSRAAGCVRECSNRGRSAGGSGSFSLECSAGAQSTRWAAGVCRLCVRKLADRRHVAFPAAVAPVVVEQGFAQMVL